MAITLTEQEIKQLLEEPKQLPNDYRNRMATRPKRGHRECELTIRRDDGSEFRVILRQSDHNQLAFSVILAYMPCESNQLFRLRRYNGKSHEHSNRLEGNRFYDFHIHQATERYQDSGFREDTYAETTDRFSDFNGAVECLINDCGFMRPSSDTLPLFEGSE